MLGLTSAIKNANICFAILASVAGTYEYVPCACFAVFLALPQMNFVRFITPVDFCDVLLLPVSSNCCERLSHAVGVCARMCVCVFVQRCLYLFGVEHLFVYTMCVCVCLSVRRIFR